MQAEIVEMQPDPKLTWGYDNNARPQTTAQDRSAAMWNAFDQSCSPSSIQRSWGKPATETARVRTRKLCELKAEERQEIVDLFDKGYSCSYIVRRANLSRPHIKQVLCAAGRTGIFRKRQNGSDDGANLPKVVKSRSTTVRQLLDQLRSTSSIQGSQAVPKKETEIFKTACNLTPASKQYILDLFDQGHTCCYIMEKTNMSGYDIGQVLGAAGRTFAEQNPKRYDALRPVVLRLFEQGWSLRAIKRKCAGNSPFRVEKILMDASLTPKSRPAATSPLQSHHEGGASGAGTALTILLEDGQCGCSSKETGLYQEAAGIAQDRSDIGCGTDTPPGQFSEQGKQEEEIVEHSTISPDRCARAASEIPLLPPDNPSTSGRSARYQCQICRLHWDEEKDFLLHLADKEHEQLLASRIFLYCTGCKFKTRKPGTMGRHIVKYQSQNALQDCMHSITTIN
ncbi:uncharacterized protein LOC129592249 [Paramacrobiotus metropolitanus]|uniref:uncharacterized protein LOC129592249 n=1 Tax=Paramacrobiotus metropolitanus TaxID=2943436 RepID=UPI002445AA18|nr:uncharacterized protein LOC129592249 [Paramacrobiotus metropolitanus]